MNNSELREWALFYGDNGLKIFPVKENGKIPIIKNGYKSASSDRDQIEKWWNQYPNANIGLATGENGLYVVDIDKKNNSNGFKSLEENNIKLPETLRQYTPSGGIHYIYKATDDYRCKVNLLNGVDIRAKGGYIVVAPSVINGRKYSWFDVTDTNNLNKSIKPYNDELKGLYNANALLEADKFILPLEIGQGERNDILFKYASSMQAKKYTDSQIQDELIKVNNERCTPPLGDKELSIIINSALKYDKGNSNDYYVYPDGSKIDLSQFHRFRSDGKGGFTNTPIGVLVDVLAQYIINSYNFKVVNGKFWVYENGVYQIDDNEIMMINIIKKYIYPFLREPKNYKPVVEHIKLDIKIQATLEEMNNHPDYLINLKNGMFDVRNMMLLEHDKKYKSINQIPWELDPKYLDIELCDIPNFNEFISTSTQSKDDVKMILEFMANCLSISSDSQKTLLLTGSGGTGKSVLLNLIIKIVGENNTSTIPLQALSERFTTQMLQGKLLNAYADLTSKALSDTSNFKTITGQDVVKAEYKHGAVFSFRSYAKLLFSANTLPKNLDEESNAFYRRLLIAEIKRGSHIPSVNKTLADEIPMILGLLMKIAHEVDKRHWELFESDNSKELVKGLQKISDSVTAFLNDRIIKLEGSRVKKVEVFNAYEQYCLNEGRRPKGKTAFYEAMRNKKIAEVKYQGLYNYKDINILEDTESLGEFDFFK